MEELDNSITASVKVNVPIDLAWKLWSTPADIMQWNMPYDNWHCPRVENDLSIGGKFLFRMETKDASEGFDHAGTYDQVIANELIGYTGNDGRKSIINFEADGNSTLITEAFEPDKITPIPLQKEFCQSVLDKFKHYAETQTIKA